MKILFISDFFKNSGLGNYIRTKNLYNFVKNTKKHKCYFYCVSKLPRKKILVDTIVMDLPNKNYNIKEIINRFSNLNTRVIGLDYNFKTKIDCNISIFKRNYYAKKNFVGLKYTIIREELYRNKYKVDKNLFLIAIGSSDIKNIKKKVKKIFTNSFKNIFVNKNLILKNKKFKQISYIKKMIACRMAASNGGTTLLELIFLKKIVFVYPQNILEYKFAKFLLKQGFKILINKYKIDNNLLSKLKKMKQKNNIIDNKGLSRISRIITSC